jgi:hypothetical protein
MDGFQKDVRELKPYILLIAELSGKSLETVKTNFH